MITLPKILETRKLDWLVDEAVKDVHLQVTLAKILSHLKEYNAAVADLNRHYDNYKHSQGLGSEPVDLPWNT